MTPLSVADGARLLGIHPKTLCHWLKQANISLAAHPADARIKGVTQQDLHQLASLHGRPLQSSVLGDAVSPSSVPSQVQALSGPQKERDPASTSASFPRSSMHEADQSQRLASLETRMLARESADCSAHVGPAKGAGAIGRASPHGPRIPPAPTGGKTALRTARS